MMAYNDYGAYVWEDDERKRGKEDARLFADRDEETAPGMAVFESIVESRGTGRHDAEWDRCYHAVLGDGDVRVGVYKTTGFEVVRRNADGTFEELFHTYLGNDDLVRKFGLKRKPWVCKTRGRGRAGKVYYDITQRSDLLAPRGHDFVSDDAGYPVKGADGEYHVERRKLPRSREDWFHVDKALNSVHWWRKRGLADYRQGTKPLRPGTYRFAKRHARRAIQPTMTITKELDEVTLSFRLVEIEVDPQDSTDGYSTFIGQDHNTLTEVVCDFHDGHRWSARVGGSYGSGLEDTEESRRFVSAPEWGRL
jgi:hypothetical protein